MMLGATLLGGGRLVENIVFATGRHAEGQLILFITYGLTDSAGGGSTADAADSLHCFNTKNNSSDCV